MSDATITEKAPRRKAGGKKAIIWLAAAACLLLFIGANIHFLYLAITSQPDCVPHLKLADHAAPQGSFSAAQSACSPQNQSGSE